MPRLFVAIDLPEQTKNQVLSLRQDDLPPGRWPRRAVCRYVLVLNDLTCHLRSKLLLGYCRDRHDRLIQDSRSIHF